MLYCPNCSAKLTPAEPALACWNCGADFGPASAWRPVDEAPGPFRAFPRNSPPPVLARSIGPMNPFAEVALRFVIGGFVWMVFGLLAAASAIPYGGGGSFFSLWGASTIVIGIWIFLPLGRLGSNASEEEGDPPLQR